MQQCSYSFPSSYGLQGSGLEGDKQELEKCQRQDSTKLRLFPPPWENRRTGSKLTGNSLGHCVFQSQCSGHICSKIARSQKWSGERALERVPHRGMQGAGLSAGLPAAKAHFWGTTIPGFLLKPPRWLGQASPLAEPVGAVQEWSRQAVGCPGPPRLGPVVGITPQPNAVWKKFLLIIEEGSSLGGNTS